MADDPRTEVYRQLRTAQDKYSYFVLAAAGAAIALAVNQTHAATLAWSLLPLGAAVLAWGLSFFIGCRSLEYVAATLYGNAQLISVERGEHREVGRDPERMAAASAGIRSAIESNSNRGNRLAHWQFRLLILGAVFYLGWHVWEMWLRTLRH